MLITDETVSLVRITPVIHTFPREVAADAPSPKTQMTQTLLMMTVIRIADESSAFSVPLDGHCGICSSE